MPVNITSLPIGLLVTVDGSSYTTPKTFNWSSGTTHSITTPASQYSLDQNTKYNFSSWSDGGAQTHTITTPSSSTTYTANFATQYLLDITVSPSASGTVTATPSGPWYNPGQTGSLTASAASGYTFSSWSGVDSASGNTASVTMHNYRSVTATFSSTGTLQVNLAPAEAVSAGAQWQVDGGPWQNSGATVSGLSVGSHPVAFKAISGWTAPGSQTVTINANQTTTATGTYVPIPETGLLQVNLVPTEAVNAGAQWQVDGGPWQNSGATVSGLSVGSHPVAFKAISGWTAPGSQTVMINVNQTTAATGTYVVLCVTATQAVSGGYRSPGTLTVNCQFMNCSGQSLISLNWRPKLPAGWTVNSVTGDGNPELRNAEIVFVGTLTANPINLSYTVTVPAGETGNKDLAAPVDYQLNGMVNPLTIHATPDPLGLTPVVYHTADYRDLRWQIDGTEVNRVLSYWRAGGHHADAAGLDGFAPGTGDTSGTRHTADYRAPYWVIDGTEVNRVLSYWRAGAYHADAAGLDGFAPGTAAGTSVAALQQQLSAATVNTITQSGPANYAADSSVQITNRFNYSGTLLSLLLRPQLPSGWTLSSATGNGTVEIQSGEIVLLGSLPPSLVEVVMTVQVPAGQSGVKNVRTEVEYQFSGDTNPGSSFAIPDPLAISDGVTQSRLIRLAGNLNFGNVGVGTTSNRNLTIFNDGNAMLTVSSINYPPAFSGAWSGAIAAGGSQNVTVTFSPNSAISSSGNLTVNSDATNSGANSLPVSGTGVVDSTGPALTISNPLDGSTLTSSPITVSGTATDSGTGNSGINSVTVNGTRGTKDSATGGGTANWSATLYLTLGANTITAVATDGANNQTTLSITVTYTPSTAPDFVWAKRAEGNSDDYGKGIAIDVTGNIYITGKITGSATFGSILLNSGGNSGFFIAKHDRLGNVVWAKSAGGNPDAEGYAIAVDSSGNSFVTGYFRGSVSFGSITLTSAGSDDIFVAKYDSEGNVLWAKRAGGGIYDYAFGIALDAAGNCFVVGQYPNNATFDDVQLSSGRTEFFIAKYDSAGRVLWAKSGNSANGSYLHGVTIDSAGNIYVTGTFHTEATFGATVLTGKGSYDAFVAKYDSDGNPLWARQAGGADIDYGESLAVDSSGNVYVTGYFAASAIFGTTNLTSAGLSDVFVAKYDNSGQLLWVQKAGGSSEDYGRGIRVDNAGNCYVTGSFSEESAVFGDVRLSGRGSADIFVACLDKNGGFSWVRQAGGASWDEGKGIALDSVGNIILTGGFQGIASFGNTNLTSAGGSDIFLANLSGTLGPVITQHPQGQTGVVGSTITFNVTATGTPPLSYQWQKNGVVISGATSATLTLANVQAADAGSYTVVVSNSGGSVTSQGAVLIVQPLKLSIEREEAWPVIRWPVDGSEGFVLEQADDLAGPWTAVSVAPEIIGNWKVVLIEPMEGKKFYRLRKL